MQWELECRQPPTRECDLRICATAPRGRSWEADHWVAREGEALGRGGRLQVKGHKVRGPKASDGVLLPQKLHR